MKSLFTFEAHLPFYLLPANTYKFVILHVRRNVHPSIDIAPLFQITEQLDRYSIIGI
jgi:hypothetical protein